MNPDAQLIPAGATAKNSGRAKLDGANLDHLAALIPPRKPSGSRRGNAVDNSRSAIAFPKGAALRRADKSFEEMRTPGSDPETAEWCREKGDAHGSRELQRIWEKTNEIAIDAASPEHRKQLAIGSDVEIAESSRKESS
jgi:hypothetical protein